MSMKKTDKSWWALALAAVVWIILFVAGATTGIIHPSCYAYFGTLFPLLAAFVYLYAASGMRCFGAATLLNGPLILFSLLTGEGGWPFFTGLLVLTAVAELVRKLKGYGTLKGIRWSFIPMAFSFYPYVAHWWTDREGSLQAAVEEMPEGYADKVAGVIDNVPMLVVMIVLVVPVSVLAMRLAVKTMRKQTAGLE